MHVSYIRLRGKQSISFSWNLGWLKVSSCWLRNNDDHIALLRVKKSKASKRNLRGLFVAIASSDFNYPVYHFVLKRFNY
jgi:hypothetical protein